MLEAGGIISTYIVVITVNTYTLLFANATLYVDVLYLGFVLIYGW